MVRTITILTALMPSTLLAQGKTTVLLDPHGDPLPRNAIARIGTVRMRLGRDLRAVTFSPDGKQLATSAGDQTVSIWDFADGKEVHRFKAANGWGATGLSFSPNGRLLAVADNALQIYDTNTGKLIFQTKNNRRSHVVRFASDGKTLLTSGFVYPPDAGFVDVWDVKTWKPLKQFEAHRIPFHGFSPDGELFAQTVQDNVWICSTMTGKKVRPLPRLHSPLQTMAFSTNCKYVATADVSYEEIRVHDLTKGKIVFRVREIHTHPKYLTFHDQDKLLTVVGSHGQVRTYDLGKKKKVKEFRAFDHTRSPFALSSDGKWLAGHKSFRLWRMSDGTERKIGVRCDNFAKFLPDGERVIVGKKLVRICDAKTGFTLRMFKNRDLRDATYSRQLGTLLEFAMDSTDTMVVKDVLRNKALAKISRRWVNRLSRYSPDAKYGLWVEKEPILHLYDIEAKKILHTWRLAANESFAIHTFSADGSRVLLAIMRTTGTGVARNAAMDRVLIYDVANQKRRFHWEVPRESLAQFGALDMTYSPDNRLATTYLANHRMRIWEIASNQPLRDLSAARALHCRTWAFSPDSRLLADVRDDGGKIVTVWDIRAGKAFFVCGGHRGHIKGVDFSHDGSRLASVATDGTALIWKVPHPKRIKRIRDKTLQELWRAMRNPDPKVGWRAAGLMEEASTAVQFLKRMMKPAPKPSRKELQQRIADLNSDNFRTRSRAIKVLAHYEDAAESALHTALAKKTSLEQHQRIRKLLERLKPNPPGRIRLLRAVGVLEHIGTREARALLRELVKRPFHPRVRQDIRESLARLRVRPDSQIVQGKKE